MSVPAFPQSHHCGSAIGVPLAQTPRCPLHTPGGLAEGFTWKEGEEEMAGSSQGVKSQSWFCLLSGTRALAPLEGK